MHPKRKQRLTLIAFLVVGVGVTVGLALLALGENMNLFYGPDQIVAGEAPVGSRIRAGGMVLAGSVERDPDSLKVAFTISDLQGHDVGVDYEGILPDLFGEGQGVVATGMLGEDGRFRATEVLAKHDENYMPPELAGMTAAAEAAEQGAATMVNAAEAEVPAAVVPEPDAGR